MIRKVPLAAIAWCIGLFVPAAAMVGGAPAIPAEQSRHLVMIVGSRGTFCTGTAIARDLVLTAAHCVAEGAEYKLFERSADGQPVLRDVARIQRHPQFSLATLNAHRATADLALLKLKAPLPASFQPATLSADRAPVTVGESFTVAGFGVAARGDGKTSGTARSVTLTATGQPGTLQIRLFDPSTRNERAGLGACTGDSGAPVIDPASRHVIGVVSWSTGAKNEAGCGGLTGVTPLTRYRDWVVNTARGLGSPLGN
jgi:secreted trypsin-like serine protease